MCHSFGVKLSSGQDILDAVSLAYCRFWIIRIQIANFYLKNRGILVRSRNLSVLG